MGTIASRLRHGAQIGDGRALAVGSGDMNDRRQLILRIAEVGEQPPHAVERKIDSLWIERVEAIEYALWGVAVQD